MPRPRNRRWRWHRIAEPAVAAGGTPGGARHAPTSRSPALAISVLHAVPCRCGAAPSGGPSSKPESAMTTTPTFHEARDLLLRHRTDYDSAYREFRWPVLERFNWALDHFDAIARGNESTALHIVGEDGSETRRSFAEMSVRSSQVANHLRGLGVKRGDRILLMLGNELALWEVMLASIKLGAVVIPATSLLTTDDLRDRLERGAVRHIVTSSALAAKFADLPGRFTRVAIGAPVAGWQDYADSEKAATAFVADGETRADDP